MQSSDTTLSLIVPQELGNSRLDRVLAELVPDSGLRLRRRLCDDGRVTVDGRVRKSGYKVRAGQSVQLENGEDDVAYEELGLEIVKRDERFAAVYKPGGVHSAAIAGRNEPSAEGALADLFPDEAPVLMNRLDRLTSGLLLVALNPEAEQEYHAMEDAGRIRKFYRARIKKRLDGVVTVKNRLDTDNRKTTRVLDDEDEDPRRWTDVEVLSHDHGDDTTEVRCLIMKGARHQIRAHLASIGHPIVGDPVYGDGVEGDELHLEHQRVELPGFTSEAGAE